MGVQCAGHKLFGQYLALQGGCVGGAGIQGLGDMPRVRTLYSGHGRIFPGKFRPVDYDMGFSFLQEILGNLLPLISLPKTKKSYIYMCKVQYERAM